MISSTDVTCVPSALSTNSEIMNCYLPEAGDHDPASPAKATWNWLGWFRILNGSRGGEQGNLPTSHSQKRETQEAPGLSCLDYDEELGFTKELTDTF